MSESCIARLRDACASATPLVIRGHGSKDFYGNPGAGEVLDTTDLVGVVSYDPRELVLTARAGTPLTELATLLAANGQMLAFEPPQFTPPTQEPAAKGCRPPSLARTAGEGGTIGGADGGVREETAAFRDVESATPALRRSLPLAGAGASAASRAPQPLTGTLGGAVASGLSGPRRPYAGAVRDFVLGVRVIDGQGQWLRFGGQVIKNVAGYDVSRLMAGAMGTLGLITEVSLKVLPRPALEATLQFECDEATAILKMNQWAGQPLPLSATSWHAGLLTVRLSGAASAVHAAQVKLGGEPVASADEFWQRLRDHSAAFFHTRAPHKTLWRVSVKSTAPAFSACRPELEADEWIEWGGALRWIACAAPAEQVFAAARALGGHATRFYPAPRAGARGSEGAFAPLAPALLAIHRNLKQRFDPRGIFNPGRLHPDF